ncbi:hypothetical protein MRX96_044696 [Rhipicephalus microplus]
MGFACRLLVIQQYTSVGGRDKGFSTKQEMADPGVEEEDKIGEGQQQPSVFIQGTSTCISARTQSLHNRDGECSTQRSSSRGVVVSQRADRTTLLLKHLAAFAFLVKGGG